MVGVQIPGIRGPVLAGQSPKALSVVPTVDDNGSKVRLFLGVYWKTASGPPISYTNELVSSLCLTLRKDRNLL
jgi:hypothetical protein